MGKRTHKQKVKVVPWWNEECFEAIKQRNKTFGELKRRHSLSNLLEYKKVQAVVRKTIKRAKGVYWRGFCSTTGRTTPVDKVWRMIKTMRGIRQDKDLPVSKKREIYGESRNVS